MPEHYVGKDVVHQGAGLALDVAVAERCLPYVTRKNIRKGHAGGFAVSRVAGTPENLALLRSAWYCADDPNFPEKLTPEDTLLLAWRENKFAGGVVLLRVGNHFFLNNLAANNVGKEWQLQSLLLWHCVEMFTDTEMAYIDIGVSYRRNLDRFFRKWATFSYPVIFNPPALKPVVRRYPHGSDASATVVASEEDGRSALTRFIGSDRWTFVPDPVWGERILRNRGLVFVDGTERFGSGQGECVNLVDLTSIFPLQYGAVIVGLKIDDPEMWNRHGCLDFVKKAHVLGRLPALLDGVEEAKGRRRDVFARYRTWFAIDGVEADPGPEEWLRWYPVRSPWNAAYARRLKLFDIDFEEHEDGAIRLPVHQGLDDGTIDYVYGVFRGVLNLCSEWKSTGVNARFGDGGT